MHCDVMEDTVPYICACASRIIMYKWSPYHVYTVQQHDPRSASQLSSELYIMYLVDFYFECRKTYSVMVQEYTLGVPKAVRDHT